MNRLTVSVVVLLIAAASVAQAQSTTFQLVSEANPQRVGGQIVATRKADGTTTIAVSVEHGMAGTTYRLFLKGVRALGDLPTNAQGAGTASFTLAKGEGGDSPTFEMYPLETAFQSVLAPPQVTTTTSTPPQACNQRTFKAVVSNQMNPSMSGSGLPSVWSYKGFIGMQAGKAMCQDIGADHVCSYEEIVQADAKGELANISSTLTYWLHRTTNLVSNGPIPPPRSCSQDSDCTIPNITSLTSAQRAQLRSEICDPVSKVCSWKAGAGGRCNEWTFPGNHIAAGEWFRRTPDPNSSGGVVKGSLSYHFLRDTSYDGKTAPVCQDVNVRGCGGSCQGSSRAILCCFPKVQGCP